MPEKWSRRSLLATVGLAALAGCPAATDGSDDPSPATTDTPAQTRSPTPVDTATAPDSPTDSPGSPEPPDSIDDEWPLPDHDPGRSNYAPAATGPTTAVAELWATETGSSLSAPIVADGSVYVGDDGGTVRALDARTGDERWRRTVGETAGPPRAIDDAVYVPGEDTLVALDAGDGTEAWTVETGTPIGDFVAAGHGLYYVTDDPALEAMDETPSVVGLDRNGDERWRTTIEDPWQATIFAGEERVFVPTGTHDIRPWTFATDTGEVLNDRQPMRGADFPSARFYRDGRLFSIDGFFGNVRIIPVTADTNGQSWGIGNPGQYAASGGTDRVYLLNESYDEPGARLFGVSLSDGTVDWQTSGLAGWTAPPVVTRDAVLVNTGEQLRCFAPDDGSEQWSRPADLVGGRFVVVDDLVVTTDGTTVSVLRPP